MYPRVLIVAAVAFATLTAGCAGAPKTSRDFNDVTKEIKSITVMPPTFSIGKIGAFSAQSVAAMTHDIEVEIKKSLEALVDESRFDVAVLDASDEALSQDPDLRTKIFEQNQGAGKALEKIGKTRGKTIDVEYTADVDYFADKTGSDYILFTGGSGWFKTAGAQVKEAAVGALLSAAFGGFRSSGPSSNTALSTFLVDANRGKVIWYYSVAVDNSDPRKPSKLLDTCKRAMKPLLGTSRLKGDKSRDDEISDRYKSMMKEGTTPDTLATKPAK